MNATPTETEFLAARRASHAKRLGVSSFAHAAYCTCGRPDTFCARCDRDDFECPSDALIFTGRDYACRDCLDLQGE